MKSVSLYSMIVLYLVAGFNHFIHPQVYMNIMPPWLPYHRELVLISGIFEILFAVLLIFPRTRRAGAWGIILLLLAVFPANIQMLLNNLHQHNLQFYLSVIRLPVQILLIWWAYRFAGKGEVRTDKVSL